jgi:CheY-like chemotaxis protein
MATVLIADDDIPTRMLVVMLLRHAGHEAIEASDGNAALLAVEEHRPDLLIIDLSMPGLSGSEVVRRIRRDSKELEIALYTASPVNDAMRDFVEMYRVRAIIPKPSEPRELLEAIESALASSGRRGYA